MISALKQKFQKSEPIQRILRDYSQSIKQLLIHVWQSNGLEQEEDLVLLAVGGLAREELFPYSDVDLLILHHFPISQATQQKLHCFFDQLWNANLKPMYSIRELDYCICLATQDIRVMTTLLDATYIMGNKTLLIQLRDCAATAWSDENFLQALQESIHKNYQIFPLHSLNIKNSPGGLRNMQMLKWLQPKMSIPNHIDRALNDVYFYLLECRMALHLVSGYKCDFFSEEIENKLFTLRKDLIINKQVLTETLYKQNYRINEIIRSTTFPSNYPT